MALETECLLRPNLGTSADVPSRTSMIATSLENDPFKTTFRIHENSLQHIQWIVMRPNKNMIGGKALKGIG